MSDGVSQAESPSMTKPQIKAALPAECRSEALGADENGVTI
jgi:hypothetical protein